MTRHSSKSNVLKNVNTVFYVLFMKLMIPLHRRKSKEKGNDQELLQPNPTYHPQNQSGKKDTHKNDKRSRKTSTVNRMNCSFSSRGGVGGGECTS